MDRRLWQADNLTELLYNRGIIGVFCVSEEIGNGNSRIVDRGRTGSCGIGRSAGVRNVIVFSNHSEGKVSFRLIQPDGKKTEHVLERWAVLPVPAFEPATLVFGDGPETEQASTPGQRRL